MTRQLLERAVGHHRRGEGGAARELYRQVLAREPNQPDALHLLGLLSQQEGDPRRAAELIRRAIARDPRAPEFQRSLAGALLALDDREGAKQALRTALSLRPTDHEVALRLGAMLLEGGNPATALVYLRRAVELRPALAEPRVHLAAAYRRLERWADAEDAIRSALAHAPDDGTAHLVLGDLLTDIERYAEAETAYRRAVALLPDVPETHSNYGRLLERLGRLDESVRAHERALELDPALAGAHWSYGIALLRQGRLREGWGELAWRWRSADFVAHRYAFRQPEWRGEPLAERHILAWGEQGVGDEIMFASCIPDLLDTGARVTLAAAPRLVPLFARSFPAAEVISLGRLETEPPASDFHLSTGDLPRFFRPSVASFPSRAAYLRADPARVAAWRARLAELGPAPTVGISWRSQYMTAGRERSYTTLDEWAPILAVPGVTFVNLQYDDCALALATARDRHGVEIHAWPDIDLKDDFEATAALISALDLVVTVPNSVGELAGALGRPVWRLHRAPGTWTMLGTDRRPWFPSMRVFEANAGDVPGLMAQVAGELGRVGPDR
jgi:Tfp pilus assembly protein PilF